MYNRIGSEANGCHQKVSCALQCGLKSGGGMSNGIVRMDLKGEKGKMRDEGNSERVCLYCK